MALTEVALIDLVEQMLQDSANAVWTVAELRDYLDIALREVSDYIPFERIETFEVEGRYGVASTTSTGNLVDTPKGQFASTDVDKVVYNITDKTWAIITDFSSTAQVALSKDIMAKDEQYRLLNKRCRSNREIYIGDVTDFLGVDRVEYPAAKWPPEYRNWEIVENNQVLRIGLDSAPDDTSQSNADKEVNVYFRKRHRISRLTVLSGVVAASAAAAATSLAMSSLQTSGTIQADTEFTIEDMRGVYRVTGDSTIGANTVTVGIYPPLESAASSTKVVTLVGSTLPPRLEMLVARYTAGRAAVYKGMNFIKQINTVAGTTLVSINTAQALVNAEVDQAVADLDSNRALINTITEGGGAMEAMQYALASVRTAQGYSEEAMGHTREGQARLQVAAAGNALVGWGQAELRRVRALLHGMAPPRVRHKWSREL